MKKILMVLMGALVMTACTSTAPKETMANNFNYSGVLAPIEMSIWQYGTHTLTTTEGDFYAVKSDTIDLNNYNNTEVSVEGELIEGYPVDSGPEYMDIKDIQPVAK